MDAVLSSWLSAHPPVPRPGGIRALTTVERTLAFLAPDQGQVTMPEPQLASLRRLILATSGLVLNFMNRDTLARVERTETYPSSRTGKILLRHYPALSVASVTAPPAPPIAADRYALEMPGETAQRVIANQARGGSFICGADGLSVVYQTGYVKWEEHTVPSNSPYTVQTDSVFLFDEGVSDQAGVAVSGYTVSATGLYTFPSGLAGETVRLFYSYVPEDIEGAVVEETAIAWRSRQRIGEQSKALPNGGGTSSYLPRALSEVSKQALRNYVRVVPA